MLSTDKLTNYNNIQASVEKLTDERTKEKTIEALNNLSDEQLQVVNSRSDILDKILRGIERYNNEKRRKGESNFYGKDIIRKIINQFSQGRYDRLINTNPNVLELLVSHCIYIQDSFDYHPEIGNSNHFVLLNDDKFRCLVKNEDFCKFLLKTNHMSNFLSTSSLDDFMSNESFKICISNQDLILVYCFTSKNYSIHPLKDLMVNPNRNSMIGKLYSLEQQGKLRCDKKTLDLILLNLPIIKQMVYNDTGDEIIVALDNNDYGKVSLLLAEQILDYDLACDRETPTNEINQNSKLFNPKKLSTLSALSFTQNVNISHLIQDYDRKYSEYKEIHAEDAEEKAQQREGKLNQAQVTQAISNVQSLT